MGEALVEADVVSFFDRRQDLTSKFLNNILNDESHKLYELLPCTNFSNYITSGKRKFSKVLIVGQIGIETVLFRTILQCITDNLYLFLKFDVIQPNGLQCFKLIKLSIYLSEQGSSPNFYMRVKISILLYRALHIGTSIAAG